MTKLTKEFVDDLFTMHNNTSEIVVALYRHCVPTFDLIDKIENFPKINPETNKYIMRKMIELDNKNKVTHMKGGLWFNSGFSTDINIPEWSVSWEENK